MHRPSLLLTENIAFAASRNVDGTWHLRGVALTQEFRTWIDLEDFVWTALATALEVSNRPAIGRA